MNRHPLFRLGKVCVGLSALAAPAPLITCALDGRAGASVLLPMLPMAAGIALLAAHGTNAGACDACMTEIVDDLASASVRRLGITVAEQNTYGPIDLIDPIEVG